ncbi:6492_t:CDS:10 [Gigaspora margarita]|uniref:6492_t:CDS:1 n=1 Tax=Gigaspora margarita TaxID=4874 RepID=A0ABN7UAZ1_GIGMA|nr:6492_t:CDS:10 [Gigaspora margarita]
MYQGTKFPGGVICFFPVNDSNKSLETTIRSSIIKLEIFYKEYKGEELPARSINGSDNNAIDPTAGTPQQPYLSPDSSPVTSPTDFLGLNPNGSTIIKCTDKVPPGMYPMPRCVSNIMCSYHAQPYDFNELSRYRSFRRTSHFLTFFGQFIVSDIALSRNTNPTYPIFLPADDPLYDPNPNSTESPYQIHVPFLPANRSDGNNDTNLVTRNPLLSGKNLVTPFLDLNNIYGLSDQDAIDRLRDTSSNRGKLKTSIINGEHYPPKNLSNGNYIWGSTSEISYNIFLLAIQTIWIREHNRLSVAEEYFGAILGRPLPAYQKYNPDLKPGIDTFFQTVTFRYGHSELSDFYRIQDEYGDTIYNLALNDIKNFTLLEQLGLERVLWSIILQRQEEVDIFFSNSTKKFISPELSTYDLVAFDILSSRDRGIPLYNVARQYFGFTKATSFADISSKPYIQANLAKIYPNGVDSVEAYIGVMSEDHLNGSNFGMVMNASMVTQYTYIRDSDKFWFENPDMFNSTERKIIRNTTLRDIIIRNLNKGINFPQNIWAVQPQMKLNNSDDDNYPNKIDSWTQYKIRYKIDFEFVYFKVQLQTSDGNGWFGMGFDPDDEGMKGAEFIIGIVTNGNVTLGNYHADVGGYHPPILYSNQDPTLVPKFSMSDSKAVTVEFKRLLQPPGRKPITNSDMKFAGGISISAFGCAAISTVIKTQTPHACDLWWRFGEKFQRSFFRNKIIGEQRFMLHTYINYNNYVKLPEFTWEEINERVQRGAIGTDITNDFYNTHQNTNIEEDIVSPEALLIPKDISYGNFPPVLAKYLSHYQRIPLPRKLSTIDRLIDNFNKMYYLKAPLAQHTHSRFATQKMASMVIGKVVEKEHLIQNDEGSFFATQESDKNSSDFNTTFTSTFKNIQFHRYKLTSKVMVNANVKYPVIRFTFSRVHQDKNDISNQKFLPGHYIEMQSRVKGQNVIRSYTPLEGSLFKSFSIYVKIYPNGLFSQHLNEQLIGFEIQARGPFDVCNRSRPHHMSTKPLSSASYYNCGSCLFSQSPYTSSHPVFPGTSSLITYLLNPDSLDGGTGITPMLQYHLERSVKQNNNSKRDFNYKRMHLLFGNRKIEDVIDGILLEDLVVSSRGQLTVTYCLSDPPSDWIGFQGRIDLQLLQNWMNMEQDVVLTTQQTKIESQTTAGENNSTCNLQDNYTSYNSDEQNKSPSPEFDSRSQSLHETLQSSSLLSHGTADSQSSSTEPNSRERSGVPIKIKLDLVNSIRWNNALQRKIIVCGPITMMIAVEEALFNMGYNEQDIILLY